MQSMLTVGYIQQQMYEKMKKLRQGYKIFGRSVTNQPYHQPDLDI